MDILNGSLLCRNSKHNLAFEASINNTLSLVGVLFIRTRNTDHILVYTLSLAMVLDLRDYSAFALLLFVVFTISIFCPGADTSHALEDGLYHGPSA